MRLKLPKQDANLFISRRSRKPVSLRFKQLGVRMYQKRYLYIMSAPAIFLLFIFHYLPMFGIVIAFQDYRAGNGFFGSEWCGLENFRYLFKTQDAWTITRNTVGYNVIFILLNTTVSILIAIVISMINSRRTAKILQSIYIMPYFLSYAIIGIIVMAFIGRNNGFITRMISGDAIRKYDFYYHTGPWPYILTFVNMWKKVGYSAVVYLAAISGISPELYEAAMEDGICAEQARLFLPAYGMYVRWYWTASLHSVAHFIQQRMAWDAQKEIQDYARAVLELAKEEFPVALDSLL